MKVFVTQGGAQSIEESIVNEVPMVGIPFLCDQPMNVNTLVSLGMAYRLKHNDITKESLKTAIMEVAKNIK